MHAKKQSTHRGENLVDVGDWMLVHGGLGSSNEFDLFALHLGRMEWVAIEPGGMHMGVRSMPTGPTGRWGHAAWFDRGQSTLYISGGEDGLGNDLWREVHCIPLDIPRLSDVQYR